MTTTVPVLANDPRLQATALPVAPLSRVHAEVSVPGSKSYTNRAVVIAALAEGETVLEHPLLSEDTLHGVRAVERFGRVRAAVDAETGRVTLTPTEGRMVAPADPVECGNAGTVIRFLTTLASLAAGTSTVTGDARMQQRPIQDLVDALRQLGVPARTVRHNGCPPVAVEGPSLRGGPVSIRGNVSSQFTSSILLAAPYAEHDVELGLVDDLTSQPYVDMTVASMRAFGIEVERDGYRRFRVRAGQRYHGRRYRIEPDASNMSYFLAAAMVLGGRVRILDLGTASAQGDVRFLEVIERMGGAVEASAESIAVQGPRRLRGIDVDMNRMPDVVPTLAVMAAYADGMTRITNIANLRVKECDRIAALETELRKMGVRTTSTADSLTVYGGRPQGAEIDTYNDHRIAMSFAVAGLRTPGVVIRDPGCVAKSFPAFWQVFDTLR